MRIAELITNPKLLEERLREALVKEEKEVADMLIGYTKDPYLIYKYGEYIVEGRVSEEFENIIATSPQWSYHYALDVLKGRFIKGEEVISKDDYYSFNYARDVVKGRFEKEEKAIAKCGQLSYWYAHDIIKQPFIEGERTIIKDGIYLRDYIEWMKRMGELSKLVERWPNIIEEMERYENK